MPHNPHNSNSSHSQAPETDERKVKRISKFLSLVLRHAPEKIGIQLDSNGWTDINTLMQKAKKKGQYFNRATLDHLVETNNKKRFAISEDGKKIRASQGHSIDVKLGYDPVEPPEFLYHGTVGKFLEAIFKDGLLKMSRHAVHLSQDLETASNVGSRRGQAILLKVKALEMHRAGMQFFVSENGVWLTDNVPPAFIEILE